MTLKVKIEFGSQLDLSGKVLEGSGWTCHSKGNAWVVFAHEDKGNVIITTQVVRDSARVLAHNARPALWVQRANKEMEAYSGTIYANEIKDPEHMMELVSAWVNERLTEFPDL